MRTWIEKGRKALLMNDVAEAVSHFERAYQFNPDDASVCNNLGVLYYTQGHYEKARTVLQKAAVLDIDYLDPLVNLCKVCEKLECFEEAEEQIGRYLLIHPDDAKAHTILGEIVMKKPFPGRDIAKARMCFDRALQIDPLSVSARENRNLARVDVREDLIEFTGLIPGEVDDLLLRKGCTFRNEFLDSGVVSEHQQRWHDLSSKYTLFGNAIHRDGLSIRLEKHLRPPARVLDFGAGTGNVAIACALKGYRVFTVELNSLQKDFLTFRKWKYGLDNLEILDEWNWTESGPYGVVIALDVLEHIPDYEPVVRRLVNVLESDGAMVVTAPFGAHVTQPMHVEEKVPLKKLFRDCGMVFIGGLWRRKDSGQKSGEADLSGAGPDKTQTVASTPAEILRRIRNRPVEEKHLCEEADHLEKDGQKPEAARLYDMLGLSLLELPFDPEHLERSLSCFRRALEIDPDHAISLFHGYLAERIRKDHADASVAGKSRKRLKIGILGECPPIRSGFNSVMTVHEAKYLSRFGHEVTVFVPKSDPGIGDFFKVHPGFRVEDIRAYGGCRIRTFEDSEEGGDILIWQNYTPEVWTALEKKARNRFRFLVKNFPAFTFQHHEHILGLCKPFDLVLCALQSDAKYIQDHFAQDPIRAAYAPRGANRFLLYPAKTREPSIGVDCVFQGLRRDSAHPIFEAIRLVKEEIPDLRVFQIGDEHSMDRAVTDPVPFGPFEEIYGEFFNRIWVYVNLVFGLDGFTPERMEKHARTPELAAAWSKKRPYELQNIEAQMAGCTLSGVRESLIDELYMEGKTGHTSLSLDPKAIREALVRCIQESPVVREESRRFAIERHDWEFCIRLWENSFLDLYRRR